MTDATANYSANDRRRALPRLMLALCMLVLFTFSSQAKVYEIANYDIEMQVTPDGNYLITEHISYDFIEGSFTTAHREVPGKGFSAIHFISLEGIDHPIESYDVKDGRNLSVNWTYPPTSDSASFRITYEAVGALRSKNGANIIDWNPIGSGWDVPLHDIDVTITLPEDVSQVDAEPQGDLVSSAANTIQFHREQLPARTHYHVLVSFPEVIAVIEQPRPPFGLGILAGALIGLLFSALDLWTRLRDQPAAATDGPDVSTLDFLQMASLYARDFQGRRRGIAATIFALGQAGKLRLIVHSRKRFASMSPVHVEIISSDALTQRERLIVDALKRRKTLQKFAYETKTFNEVLRATRASLCELGLISRDRLKTQKRAYLSALTPLILSAGAFVYGAMNASAVWIGLGTLLVVLGLGRFISAASICIYTPKGLYAQQQIASLLDAKLNAVDEMVKGKAPEAITRLFLDLPYLTLHRKFTVTKMNRLKRHFGDVKNVEAPEWIVGDTADVSGALDAAAALESLDYVFIAILATASSTGATGVSGAGAGGSGAGGGGGGAG